MDFERQLAQTKKYVLVIFILWLPFLFTDIHKPVVWGLIFGTGVGLINISQLGYRLKKMPELGFQQAVTYMKLGYGIRLILLILSLLLAFRHPEYINLKTTAIGIFIAPFVATMLFGWSLFRENYFKDKN